MNQSNPFVRKIIYILAIGVLLIPLSLISRPAQRSDAVNDGDPGGKLAQLRKEYKLSQAQLSEIDPASETMKLASLGLRGVAVNMLWLKAREYKRTENYEQMAATLEALTKIQPSFVKVWEYQAHNLAYNVSMEFDDYEYRYHWVKKGLSFLTKGVPYNKTDHRMTDNLGFFTGNKFGKSDEKKSFRRMFRQDDEFHLAMSDFIDPDSYDTRSYGHDSWKMAYQWYDLSRDLVDTGKGDQKISDMMFFSNRPAQLRNQCLSLQEEFRSDEVIQEIWRSANEEWLEYGEVPISNTLGITITLEGMAKNEDELDALRAQLDKLVPGKRDEFLEDVRSMAELTDDEKYSLSLPPDQRTDDESRLAREANRRLNELDTQIDKKVAAAASEDNALEVRKLSSDIRRVHRQIKTIDKDSQTINYRYWNSRTKAESEDPTLVARQKLYDAQEMRRRSIYDDEFDVDYKSGDKTITRRGGISLYLDAYKQWDEVMTSFPDLREGAMANDLVDTMQDFEDMLDLTNNRWPDDFPMQGFIDYRSEINEPDQLPTTEQLEDERSGREDEPAPDPEKIKQQTLPVEEDGREFVPIREAEQTAATEEAEVEAEVEVETESKSEPEAENDE